ncbi:probable galactinol--sucrose galactosyltransferase 1 [Gossypium hirsutum]|uniref:galactinol--sucrose galactosyltransferase n=3 Tax=Gossypium TaxID=3633 RepID=A0ABM3BHN9_GOSHI|nr:probable galactinol--sucrose galactosyltransferase 1 [Gossypium hirsutum]
MTFGAGISLSDGRLTVFGNCVLHDVHENVVITPTSGPGDAMINGAFIGVKSDHKGSRRVFPIGRLRNKTKTPRELRFMCVFRHNFWWMTQWMGTCGKDIPFETQFLVVEVCDETHIEDGDKAEAQHNSAVYAVFLPILEGDFRAVLQGNEQNEIEICLESGDPDVDQFKGSHLVFVAAGSDPYDVITNSVKTVEKHLQTFSHREKKKMPDILNWFGWCTWDAFYTNVSAEGLKQGLESLEKGGTPPKFVIIDDGWQMVGMDPTGIEYRSDCTANFANRLILIKENQKFQKNGKGHRVDDPAMGLGYVISEMKDRYALKYVYVWHAITGYWGGVKPGITEMEHYEPKLVYPVSSPGVQSNDYSDVLQSITINGVGFVKPEKAFEFYNDLHSYLASAGIDGVKVDVQSILETLGAGHGGRVKLTRKYHQALEASISSNFHDNAIIACMSHNTDTLYSAKSTAVMRASDDFFPRDQASHTIHIASVAYNTVFIGEFIQPDWDMFHSLHPMAEYHGAARAVGGCAIYVSDKPGQHDFNLLKKLVLPDGSVLRAKYPGRPTRDCLFSDPVRDGKSLLKIWNLNDFTGVIGVFNCQGAGWCEVTRKMVNHDELPGTITSIIRASDVEYLFQVAEDGWIGDSILYSHLGGEVTYLPRNEFMSITLKPREYEVFTIVPVMALSSGSKFAPIGLTKMFNSGGAIKGLKYETENPVATVIMKVRGCGPFGAYSSTKPQRITVDSEEVEFEYEGKSGLVTFALKVPEEEQYLWNIVIEL